MTSQNVAETTDNDNRPPVLPPEGAALLTGYRDHGAKHGVSDALKVDAFMQLVTTHTVVDMDEMRRQFPGLSPDKLANKAKAGHCIVPALTGEPYTGRDGREHRGIALWSNLLVLDVEQQAGEGMPVPPPLADVARQLEAMEVSYAMHSTFKHAPDAPRYRVFVFLSEPLYMPNSTAKRRALTLRLAERLGLSAVLDVSASCDLTRILYLPRCPSDGPEPETYSVPFEDATDGRLLGIDPATVDDVPTDTQAAIDDGAPTETLSPATGDDYDVELVRLTLAGVPQEGENAPNRDDWVAIGHAVRHALGDAGWPLFQEFSSRHASHDEEKCERMWRSVTNPASDRHAVSKLFQARRWACPALLPMDHPLMRRFYEWGRALPWPSFFSRPSGARGPGRPSQLSQILPLADGMTFYKDVATDDVFVDALDDDDVRRTYRLRSGPFREVLTHRFVRQHGRAPTRSALDQALDTLAARSLDTPARKVFLRFASDEQGDAWLDLGDSTGRAVHIAADGWRIVPSNDVPVRFYRPPAFHALPEPERVDNVRAVLRAFQDIAHIHDDDLPLWYAAITMTVAGRGPLPALSFEGPPGAAKTSTATLTRLAIDPVAVPTVAPPRKDDDGMVIARGNAVVVLDNVSKLTDDAQDWACRVVSGGGLQRRQLYTDGDMHSLYARRGLMLTGIGGHVTRGDLLDRTLFIEVPAIEEADRKLEAEVMAAFNPLRAELLGALLDGVVSGIAMRGGRPATLPRMADFYVWGVSACLAMADAGAFETRFRAQRLETAMQALSDDPVLDAVAKLFALPQPAAGDAVHWPGRMTFDSTGALVEWTGTAGNLLTLLTSLQYRAGGAPPTWPRVPRALAVALKRSATQLQGALGVTLHRATIDGHQRGLSLARAVPGQAGR